jgi:PKD repeat protein
MTKNFILILFLLIFISGQVTADTVTCNFPDETIVSDGTRIECSTSDTNHDTSGHCSDYWSLNPGYYGASGCGSTDNNCSFYLWSEAASESMGVHHRDLGIWDSLEAECYAVGGFSNTYLYWRVVTVTPIANFTAFPTSGTPTLSVNFTDTSENIPTSWNWSFGDGVYSESQNPSHQYTSVGEYTVNLTATNSAGSNTTSKNNYITVNSPSTPILAGIFSYINVQNKNSDIDLTDSSIYNISYDSNWYNTSYPFEDSNYFEFSNTISNVPLLKFWGTSFDGVTTAQATISRSGYYSQTVPIATSTAYVKLISTSDYSANANNQTITFSLMDARGNPLPACVLVVLELGGTQYADHPDANGIVVFENLPLGEYTYVIYDCSENEIGTGLTGGYKGGDVRTKSKNFPNINHEDINDPDYYPNQDIYFNAYDGQTNNRIFPYDVSTFTIEKGWYNYTVYSDLGVLSPHLTVKTNQALWASISKEGYQSVIKNVQNIESTASGRTDYTIILPRKSLLTDYTNWYILVANYYSQTPLQGVDITVWNDLSLLYQGQTNAKGVYYINITNNTYFGLSVMANLAGYSSSSVSATPFGSNYVTYINLYPAAVTPTPIRTPTITATPTPVGEIYNQSVCRTFVDLKLNTETITSLLFNMMACTGLQNPLYQQTVLSTVIIIGTGIMACLGLKKGASLAIPYGFMAGVFCGSLLCVYLKLISWYVLGVICIVCALVVFLLIEKKGGKK